MRLAPLILLILLCAALRGAAQTSKPSIIAGHIYLSQYQTSGTLTFSAPYLTGEDCAVAPYQNIGDRAWWLTKTLNSVTVSISRPGSDVYFGVVCVGS